MYAVLENVLTWHLLEKFYANMMLETRDGPVFTLPYEVWFSNKLDSPWGLGIDHREPEQRVFGPAKPPSGANSWYANPVWIRSLQLGAAEFDHSRSSMVMANLNGMSVDLTFYADSSVSTSTGKMDVTLCQGMGFISATYTGLTPVLDSSVFVRSVAEVEFFRPGATKYRIVLENGSVWALYAFPDLLSLPLQFRVINNGHLEAVGPFTGLIQIAKLSKSTSDYYAAEAVYDAAAGSWCKSAYVSASVSGSTGIYQFNFERRGSERSELVCSLVSESANWTLTVTVDVCIASSRSII
jgi:endo-1,3(4)-beta-glucanase